MQKCLIVAAETVKVAKKTDKPRPIEGGKLSLHLTPSWNRPRLAGHLKIVPINFVLRPGRAFVTRLPRLEGRHRRGQRRRRQLHGGE